MFKVGDDFDGFLVCCWFFVNVSDKSLSFYKIIVDVIYLDGRYYNIVFVKYEFVGVLEYEVKVKYYGNVKLCSIFFYIRIYKSMFKSLEKKCKRKWERF